MALLSLATMVNVFVPSVRVTERLQLAVPVPDAVSPLARTPLIVTDEMPLSPRAESLAVPATVIELDVTVWPLVWVVIVNCGPAESIVPCVTLARKFATIVLVLFKVK